MGYKSTRVIKNNAIHTSDEGFVLVMAIFVLTILTIAGTAAMMTSTIETEIAGNEKAHKIAFYQAETGLTIGGEVIEALEAYDSVADNSYFDTGNKIKIIDGDFLFEGRDTYGGSWNHGENPDNPAIDKLPGQAGAAATEQSDIEIKTDDFNVDIDVDKIRVRFLLGSGVEFASGAEGIGVSSHKVIYNIDCVGRLPQNPSGGRAENIMGFQFIPR